MGIIVIEMHLRDGWILDWLKELIEKGGGQVQLTHAQIGERCHCHRNTARNVTERLERAGHIVIERRHDPSGSIYRLAKIETKAS